MSDRGYAVKILLTTSIFLFQNISTNSILLKCNIESDCNSKAGNNVCDVCTDDCNYKTMQTKRKVHMNAPFYEPTCNNLNCSYDSGDCLLQSQPWSKCGNALLCEASFKNDTCDRFCDNELCLYDNLKCKPQFQDGCLTKCMEKWGNGICDQDCNKVECGYDGNDCKVSGGSAVSGFLYVYAKSVIPIPSNSARFIGFILSLATRTLTNMKMSSRYNGSVPEVESLGDAGIRMLYEVQNIPNCTSNVYSVCWESIRNVARLISSAASTKLNQLLPSIGANVTITKVLACQSSFYGEDCNKACNAHCKSGCNVFDGICIDGCVGSYFGDMCELKCSHNCKYGCSTGTTCINGECNAGFTGVECYTACSKGTYGSNCALNCSSGCQERSCSSTDGTCSCIRGYNGTMCEYECSFGTYGMGCSSVCGHCLFGAACDKSNGTCLDGCDPGYYGTFCNNVCPEKTFGSSCVFNCSLNCVNGSCDGASGNCLYGCNSGWFGSHCSTNVTTIVYNNTATTTVAVAIVAVVCILIVCLVILLLVMIKRSRKSNYQTHMDRKIIIGEGKEDEDDDNSSPHSSDIEDNGEKTDKMRDDIEEVETTEL